MTLTERCIDEAVDALLNAEHRCPDSIPSLLNPSCPSADIATGTHTATLAVFNAPAPSICLKALHRIDNP